MQAFSQSLESWHQKQSCVPSITGPSLPLFSATVTTLLSTVLTEEELEAYQHLAVSTKMLVDW